MKLPWHSASCSPPQGSQNPHCIFKTVWRCPLLLATSLMVAPGWAFPGLPELSAFQSLTKGVLWKHNLNHGISPFNHSTVRLKAEALSRPARCQSLCPHSYLSPLSSLSHLTWPPGLPAVPWTHQASLWLRALDLRFSVFRMCLLQISVGPGPYRLDFYSTSYRVLQREAPFSKTGKSLTPTSSWKFSLSKILDI